MKFEPKKQKNQKPTNGGRRTKLPSRSLHGQAVLVSVDERVADLVRRYPALSSAMGPLVTEGKKKIRDFPAAEQLRLLHMVYALKKASGN